MARRRAFSISVALTCVLLHLLAPSDGISLGRRAAVVSPVSVRDTDAVSTLAFKAPATTVEQAVNASLPEAAHGSRQAIPFTPHHSPHSVWTTPMGTWQQAYYPGVIKEIVWDPHTGATMWAKAMLRTATMGQGCPTGHTTKKWRRLMGLPGDQAGHMIAQRLGGPGNLVYGTFPQKASINNGAWKTWEAEVARTLTSLLPPNGVIEYVVKLTFNNPAKPGRPTQVEGAIKWTDHAGNPHVLGAIEGN